jgi:hypothetical protein
MQRSKNHLLQFSHVAFTLSLLKNPLAKLISKTGWMFVCSEVKVNQHTRKQAHNIRKTGHPPPRSQKEGTHGLCWVWTACFR